MTTSTAGSIGSGAVGGAISGGSIGSAFGPPGTAIGAGVGLIGGGVAGYLNRYQPSKSEKQKKQLLDQLLDSVNGKGPYSDLFHANEQTFQKHFAEPAMRRFKNNTAPQIREQFAHTGQSAGTGLEDALMRAGVDMDDMINQQYMQYQQQANQNKMNGLNTVLGAPNFQDPELGWGSFGRGVLNTAGSEGFQNFLGKEFKGIGEYQGRNSPQMQPQQEVEKPLAKGFEP